MLKENLINHGGWNKRKSKKIYGYTLIETIAVIGITIIVMSIGATLISSTYSTYIKILRDRIREDEIDNALVNIDRLLSSYMIKEVIANDSSDEIEVNYLLDHNKDIVKTKLIKKEVDKLVVKTLYKSDPKPLKGTNIILKNIQNFKVVKKGELFYYNITLESGEEIIQCI